VGNDAGVAQVLENLEHNEPFREQLCGQLSLGDIFHRESGHLC
jgi:hypothetical protein